MITLDVGDDQADTAWKTIARATALGKLGSCAQIKPTKSSSTASSYESVVVCYIYTKDFDNHDDIRRVLLGLQELGFQIKSGYKPEFLSRLGLQSNNRWRLPPTLYSVKEVLAWGSKRESEQTKVRNFQ